MKKYFLLLLVWLSIGGVFAEPQSDKDIEVAVQINGETVVVDASFVVPATRQQVWAVLTDFGNMASFVSNLKESKIIGASGDTLNIFQRGTAQYGPITFPFESTRELRLTPFGVIRSRLISGNMRKMEGLTKLAEEGEQTRVTYHAESIPGVWIPPVLGKVFIAHETREQFREMRDEIIKRKQPSLSGP